MRWLQRWILGRVKVDTKNAFLRGGLEEEEIYMEQPPEFVAQGELGKVWRLNH